MGRMDRDSRVADLMNLLHRLRDWWCDLLEAWREPLDVWDSDFPDSSPPIPDDFDCPDTQPTSPGLLDTLPGELE